MSGEPRSIARSLALLSFLFMCAVSVVIFLTDDELTSVDFVLILGAPLALAILFYFVGRYHDPRASD